MPLFFILRNLHKPMFCLVFSSLIIVSSAADAGRSSIRIGGVEISKDGIKTDNIEIDSDGIHTPGVEIDSDGVRTPGVVVNRDGVAVNTRDRADAAPEKGKVVRYQNRDFRDHNFAGENLSGVRFESNDLRRASFVGSDLSDARIQASDARGANFAGADMYHAYLQSSDFRKANFSNANLAKAKLQASDFGNANFSGACLIGAFLQSSDFGGADFTNAIITGAHIQANLLGGSTMANAIDGPETCPGASTDEAARPEVTDSATIKSALEEGKDARIDLTVNFHTDSDKIVGQAHAQLLEIAKALRSKSLKKTRILIEGHTDSVGTADYNLDLSYRRALSVLRTLSDTHKIDTDRLSIAGYGENKPIASNDTANGKALNRRVTLVNQGK